MAFVVTFSNKNKKNKNKKNHRNIVHDDMCNMGFQTNRGKKFYTILKGYDPNRYNIL